MSQPISFATPDRNSTSDRDPVPAVPAGAAATASPPAVRQFPGTPAPPASSTSRTTGALGAAGAADRGPEPPAAPATTAQPDEAALGGHHRSWRVLSPTASNPATGRIKMGTRAHGVPRFDPRCVLDEDGLLRELAYRGVPRVPRAHPAPHGVQTHDYIEGEPLSVSRPPGSRLTGRQLGQITELFATLATIHPSGLELLHTCAPAQRPRDSAEFLHALLRFSDERVYQRHSPAFPGLFEALGVEPGALTEHGPLGQAAEGLTHRPFCLLHADLHRDNLIVSASNGALWTIDWELALLGDPLYDLATHLHLTRYPRAQERSLVARWTRAMEAVLPGASAGLSRDLPQYLGYKQVQSVFTDTIRHAQAVQDAEPAQRAALVAAAGRDLYWALQRAATPLGLRRVPTASEIERVYARLPSRALAVR